MTGCDTTSTSFNQGKANFVKALRRNPPLGVVINTFKNTNVTPQNIAEAGDRFLVEVYRYNGKIALSLNHLYWGWRRTCNWLELSKSLSLYRINI